MQITTTKYIDCAEQTVIAAARRRAVEKAKPYMLMLKDRAGDWIVEERYASEAELAQGVEDFARWFKDDNDDMTPEAGRDFLAVKSYDFPTLWQA